MGGSTVFKRYDVAANTLGDDGPRAEQHQEGRRAHDRRDQHLRPARRQAKEFFRYNVAANTWTTLAPLAVNVGWGGSLTYVGGSIYALSGDGKKNFYRYDIARQHVDRRSPSTPGNVADGGALTTDGTFIYAFQGKTTAFWRYDIAANTWSPLAPFSAATNQGGALVFVPGLNPEGRFTSMSASRSLVVTGDTVTVTLPARVERRRQQRRPGSPDRDADERRVVQHPDRPDARQRRRRHREHRRPRRLPVDLHGRRGRHSRQPDLQRRCHRRRAGHLPGGDVQQRARVAAADLHGDRARRRPEPDRRPGACWRPAARP